jgi:hypothetical protein
MKKMDQSKQQPTQASREETGAVRGSGRSSDTVRNAESTGEKSRGEGRADRSRPAQDDLILHDDDEAELELPR